MDLQFLRDLYKLEGPVASVHLDTSREDQDADRRIDVEWRRLRRELAQQEADEPTLAAIEERLVTAPHVVGPQGEALYAEGGRVVQAHVMASPPTANRACLLPLADPLELVIDRDHQVPYVVVAVDREGADIDAFTVGEHDPATQHTFNGSTLHISKVRAGGISSGHYHRRTENLWDRNAQQAARLVGEAMGAVGADLVLVGGDDKAAALLRDHLDGLSANVDVQTVGGGRADDGAMRSLRASVDAAISTAMRRSHERVLAGFAEALAAGRAVQGIPAVEEALASGRVEVLLLAADRGGDPLLWGSRSAPSTLSTDPVGLGTAEGQFQAPAAALLLRAAAESDAQFTELLPPVRAEDGVGAILRY